MKQEAVEERRFDLELEKMIEIFINFSKDWKKMDQKEEKYFSDEDELQLLLGGEPDDIEEYSEHMHKLLKILYENDVQTLSSFKILTEKFYLLIDKLESFIEEDNLIWSKLFIIVERNFDYFIKISVKDREIGLSVRSIEFLTMLIMKLNYVEIYVLLLLRPAVYHFLEIIEFDFNTCYTNFVFKYSAFQYKSHYENNKFSRKTKEIFENNEHTNDENNCDKTSDFILNNTSTYDENRDKFIDHENKANLLWSNEDQTNNSPICVKKNELETDSDNCIKMTNQSEIENSISKIIKKENNCKNSNKFSNYDPEIVHECHLKLHGKSNKICLRRFSRKYELIRHQETVHSRKKKLFKCFVCIKQNIESGPRIFTRHDTLAKHIRVNHKILGKEAKAEVAYSKSHAEIVEEGDMTVQIGRKKTRVDYKLRSRVEKKGKCKEYCNM